MDIVDAKLKDAYIYDHMTYKLICGNSLLELKKLDSNSIDSVVTDPPYELGFMGKEWDKSGIAYDIIQH